MPHALIMSLRQLHAHSLVSIALCCLHSITNEHFRCLQLTEEGTSGYDQSLKQTMKQKSVKSISRQGRDPQVSVFLEGQAFVCEVCSPIEGPEMSTHRRGTEKVRLTAARKSSSKNGVPMPFNLTATRSASGSEFSWRA